MGVQVALATVLLVSAGLLLHSFINALGADRGYDVDRILSVDLARSGQRYATPAYRTAFYRDLTRRISELLGALPLAQSAGFRRQATMHTLKESSWAATRILRDRMRRYVQSRRRHFTVAAGDAFQVQGASGSAREQPIYALVLARRYGQIGPHSLLSLSNIVNRVVIDRTGLTGTSRRMS